MSLKTFLNNKDVRYRFNREFNKPKFTLKKELLAPPLTKRYSLVGTAFDYLLRFYLKHLYPTAIEGRWVAEDWDKHYSLIVSNGTYDPHSGKIVDYTETSLTRNIKNIINQARRNYAAYLSSGEINDELIKSSLQLAQLDLIPRANIIEADIGIAHKEDVADLRKLISIVDSTLLKVEKLCLLNPVFGEGSKLVGGADADMFIDNMLIDIKTRKKFEFRRDDFNELIGYYTLHCIGGIGGLKPKPEITKLGIYFARYAYLHVIEIKDIVNEKTFPDFLQWFKRRASEKNGRN